MTMSILMSHLERSDRSYDYSTERSDMKNTSGKRPAVLMLLLLISLGQRATAQEKSIPEKIRIAVATSSLAFLVPFVAKDRSLYLKNGSDVELIQMRPNIAMAALISGEVLAVEFGPLPEQSVSEAGVADAVAGDAVEHVEPELGLRFWVRRV